MDYERAKSYPLHRRDVVAALLADRGDMLVVTGLGSASWDAAAAGDHPLTFPLWGAMGGAVSMALGLALAQPTRRVLVITGDGDALMGANGLASVTLQDATNLSIVVLDNGGRIICANMKAAQMLGHSERELLGQKLWEDFRGDLLRASLTDSLSECF